MLNDAAGTKQNTHAALHIGTAGWSIPAVHADKAGTGGSHLERYASVLKAVEINSSFYKPHRRTTYQRWADATPAAFRFSVKVPKAMTHERRLADCDDLIDRFAQEVDGLGHKLGVLLVQLPPRGAFDAGVADVFFASLRRRIEVAVALEPRHASWFTPAVARWLRERGIARVAADPAPVAGAGDPDGDPALRYFRWHGAPKIYFSNYDDAALAALQRRIALECDHAGSVWCVFDNTGAGQAFANALTMQAAL